MRYRRPFRWLTRTGRDRRDEAKLTLELVLQAIDRISACDEVWLAIGASKRGRGRENDARVKKLCQFLGFGLLTVNTEGRVDVVAEPAPWKPRRDAKRRSRIVEEHRRRKGDPVLGGSSAHPNDRLSSAGARRGQRACQRAESTAGPSNVRARRRQNPPGQCLWLVRADRAWTLWTDLLRSRRPRRMGQLCFPAGKHRVWLRPRPLKSSCKLPFPQRIVR